MKVSMKEHEKLEKWLRKQAESHLMRQREL